MKCQRKYYFNNDIHINNILNNVENYNWKLVQKGLLKNFDGDTFLLIINQYIKFFKMF